MNRVTVGMMGALWCGLAHAATTPDAWLDEAAHRHGLAPAVVHAVAMVESGKRCGVWNGGNHGLMQVSRGAALQVGVPWPLRSCRDEIEAGVRYLRLAKDKGQSSGVCAWLNLYKSGLAARPVCTAYGRKVIDKTRTFVRKSEKD